MFDRCSLNVAKATTQGAIVDLILSCGDDHEEEEDEANQPFQAKTSNGIR